MGLLRVVVSLEEARARNMNIVPKSEEQLRTMPKEQLLEIFAGTAHWAKEECYRKHLDHERLREIILERMT